METGESEREPMLDHEARTGLARERAAHLAEEYRRAQRRVGDPRRDAIRQRIASAVAIARERTKHGPAYPHG